MSGMFGLGDSKSSTSQSTSSIDGRVVGGDSSTNLSLNGNTGPVSITTTDAGAVSGALQIALAGVEGANQNAQAATSQNESILNGALQAVSNNQAQFTSAIEQIKTGDKTTSYVVAGFVACAIALAVIFHKKA